MRMIDADAAADKIMHEVEVHANEIGIGAVAIMIAFARALRDETDFPTIKPEVRHGRWRFEKGDNKTTCDGWICTECNYGFHTKVPYFDAFNFCPMCGAKMDGGADNG